MPNLPIFSQRNVFRFSLEATVIFHHLDLEYFPHAQAVSAGSPAYPLGSAAFVLLLSCLRRSHKPPFFSRLNRLAIDNSGCGLRGTP